MKTVKETNAINTNNAYEYEAMKKQERKQSKQLRQMKRSRKGFWVAE